MPCRRWNDQTRLQVGSFLSEAIFATELLTVIQIKQGCEPLAWSCRPNRPNAIKNTKPGATARAISQCWWGPRRWEGLYGGGVLDNQKPLIKPVLHDAGEESALDHSKKADPV